MYPVTLKNSSVITFAEEDRSPPLNETVQSRYTVFEHFAVLNYFHDHVVRNFTFQSYVFTFYSISLYTNMCTKYESVSMILNILSVRP